MILSIIGLGKMGANMARRLKKGGHEIIAFNRSNEKTNQLVQEMNIIPAYSLVEVIQKLELPRIIWLMLPAGQATNETIKKFSTLLSEDDIVIDGGNSYYRDSIRNAEILRSRDIKFVDVGVSGGIWGLSEGYSLMIGGDQSTINYLEPIFISLAPTANKGWGRVGPCGSGHFTKMVHNGIEYGMMESLAEGFELLISKHELEIDLEKTASVWQYGSVIRSWLLDLCKEILRDDKELKDIEGWVEDSGEGRWTVEEALQLAVPVPIISLSLLRRLESRQSESYALKMLAALRNKFGGHAIKINK